MGSVKVSSSVAISDNGFLFQSATGETFTTNPIGVRILNEFRNGKTFEEVVSIILDEYDVEKDQLEKDLTEFLNQLHAFNLVDKL